MASLASSTKTVTMIHPSDDSTLEGKEIRERRMWATPLTHRFHHEGGARLRELAESGLDSRIVFGFVNCTEPITT